MSDINQLSSIDLSVALGDPGLKTSHVQLWVVNQSQVDSVDDEMQKISFISRIPSKFSGRVSSRVFGDDFGRIGEYNPIRAARGANLCPRRAQLCEQVATGARIARRSAVQKAFIHAA